MFIASILSSRRDRSHPTGVRGLKLDCTVNGSYARAVAPHWGAWIEIQTHDARAPARPSHPTGVRGLKCRVNVRGIDIGMSHPTGVRGLKFAIGGQAIAAGSRTPLGCVD